jgi:VWFA-related protein
VIVSDGDDTISDLETTLEKVVQKVQAKNCQIYVVKTTDFENFKKTGRRVGNANLMNLTAEHRMQELAKQTGGSVYSPLDEKELDDAFTRISAELSQQYILSYYPDEKMLSGDFHAISLKVKNKPGLTVRTRKGYYVPRKK